MFDFRLRIGKARLFLLMFFTSLLLITSTEKAKACHSAGIDLWVVYTGPGIDGCTGTTIYSYDVYLSFYTACQTCAASPSPNDDVIVYSPTLGPSSQMTIPVADPHGTEEADTVFSLCPQYHDSNSCNHIGQQPYITLYPAYRHRTLIGSVTLPSAQTDWTFSYSTCCRNNANNMPTCTGGFYAEVLINNLAKYNVSSPHFTSNPFPYICVNQPNVYLTSPFSPSGDSMAITQVEPYQSATVRCNFPGPGNSPPSTVDAPIVSSASNPYTLNPTTGAVTFTPLLVDNYLLTFQATSYERGSGIELAHAIRDAQVNVVPCTTPPPPIDSIQSISTVVDGASVPVLDENGKKSGYAIVTCPGNNLRFTVNSKSPGRNLYMYADTGKLANSTFSVVGDGTDDVAGTVTWTPTVADIGEHTLTIKSADSTCTLSQPIVVYNYTVIYIKVTAGLDAGKDLLTCKLNPPKRQFTVRGQGNLLLRYKWSDIGGGPAIGMDNDTIFNPVVSAPGGTQYVVYSPDLTGQCKARDTVGLVDDTSNTIDIFPQTDKFVMCRPGYLQLDAVTYGGGPVSNVKCDTVPVFSCPKPDSVTLFGPSVYGTDVKVDTLGAAAPIFNGDVLSERFQFLVTKDELKLYGMRSGTIRSLSFEVTQNTTTPKFEYANFTIYIKCTDKKALSKSGGFETGMIPVYTAPANITLEDGWHNFVLDKPYNWDTTKNLVIGMCYSNNPALLGPCTPGSGFPGLLIYTPTNYVSTLDLKAPDNVTTDICNANTLSDIKERYTRPVFGMTFCDAPGKPFDFTWYPGTLLSDSTIRQPLTYVPRTTTYQVATLGKNGCKVADTLQVYVPVHNFSVWPADTSICYGQTVPLEVRNGNDYQWFEYEEGQYKPSFKSLSCDYCANPVAKPLKSTRYKIMVGDEVFCYDTIDAYIEVRPLPQVHILTPDTVVKYGHSVQLLVNGAKMYNWTPVSSLNNPNISYPLATPTEPTMYVVSGISATGCYSYDTVRVGIDYRDNLNIPTAFSPNGDGKNDVFRVTNITFQKIVEFRVFNRWGQEVYNGGGDSGAGWDGNWKGVPQEIGDYSYLVRVSSPDGLVETYKGNVTLIR